MLKLRI